jgi:hypothetical protein
MNGLRWIVLPLLIVAAACGSTERTVTGSPNVVTTSIAVASFTGLEVGDDFEVEVSIGDREQLALRVNENLIADVDVSVSNGTLHLGVKPGLSLEKATLHADVTAVRLTDIQIGGAAHVHVADPIQGQQLRLGLSGAGGFEGMVTADQADAELSGSSQATLTGSLGTLTLTESGASQVDAADLDVGDLAIELSGASMASIAVTGTISAQLSGASTLEYLGNPRFTRKDVSGASTIKQG